MYNLKYLIYSRKKTAFEHLKYFFNAFLYNKDNKRKPLYICIKILISAKNYLETVNLPAGGVRRYSRRRQELHQGASGGTAEGVRSYTRGHQELQQKASGATSESVRSYSGRRQELRLKVSGATAEGVRSYSRRGQELHQGASGAAAGGVKSYSRGRQEALRSGDKAAGTEREVTGLQTVAGSSFKG